MNDADNAENALKEGQQFIDKIGNRWAASFVIYAHGKINELRGNYKTAIQHYRDYQKDSPTDLGVETCIGICYRNIKRIWQINRND